MAVGQQLEYPLKHKGYWTALCHEFEDVWKKAQLKLTYEELEVFATSPFFTVSNFYYYRLAAATYMGLVLMASLFTSLLNMDGTITLYFIYYTRWSLLVLEVYLVTACLATRRHAVYMGDLLPRRRPASASASTSSACYSSAAGSSSFVALAAAFGMDRRQQQRSNGDSGVEEGAGWERGTARGADRPMSSTPGDDEDVALSLHRGAAGTGRGPDRHGERAPLFVSPEEEEEEEEETDPSKSSRSRASLPRGSYAALGTRGSVQGGGGGGGAAAAGAVAQPPVSLAAAGWSNPRRPAAREEQGAGAVGVLEEGRGSGRGSDSVQQWEAESEADGRRIGGGVGGGGGGGGGGVSLRRILKTNEPVRPDTLVRVVWTLQNVIYPNALLLTALFWLVIYPGVTLGPPPPPGGGDHDDLGAGGSHTDATLPSSSSSGSGDGGYSPWRHFMVVQQHGVNFVAVALDVTLSNAPCRMAHAHHAASYTLTYLAFSLLYYFDYGLNDGGNRYIYPQLNWAQPVHTGIFVVGTFAVALPLAVLATWSLWFLSRAFLGPAAARYYRRRHAVARAEQGARGAEATCK